MKISVSYILFILLLFAGLGVKAQTNLSALPIDPDTKLITYKEVVTVTGTQSELFNRAIEWINKQYKNPADVTKVRNPSTGIIDIIYRIELTKDEKGVTRAAGIVDYSMKIELKEGRYRYTITNFNSKDASRQPIEQWMNKADKAYNPLWDSYLNQIDEYTHKLIEGLKTGMLPPAPKKVDEW
jgi:hypothetical protein